MKLNKHSPLQTEYQKEAELERSKYFNEGLGDTIDKLRSVNRFIGRQELAKIIAYTDIFRKTSGVVGSIADCGVFFGGGLMTYANLCAALEPYNYQLKVLGFDTFEGDVGHTPIDKLGTVDREMYNYCAPVFDDLSRCATLFDLDRPVNHLSKIELVQGDLRETSAQYIADNPQVCFRIIHLSVNLYAPTKETILRFYPRLSRGGALVIQGLNYTVGATQALFDAFDELNLTVPQISHFDYFPNITYLIKE